ncbi:poly(3-hydroxybutyrate) depolymerase, partial [Escherichia coli]
EIITGVQNMEQEQDVLQQQMLYTLQQRMNEMSL